MKSPIAALVLALLVSTATVHASPVNAADDLQERQVDDLEERQIGNLWGYTRVLANGGLYCRARPNLKSKILRTFKNGEKIKYYCAVSGDYVRDYEVWLKIDPGPHQAWCWVPQTYTWLPKVGSGDGGPDSGPLDCPDSDWPGGRHYIPPKM